MSKNQSESQGCRSAAVATGLLVGFGLAFMAIGVTLLNDESCVSGCETVALTLLYAGFPVSAVIGVLFGDPPLAWPLDITLWVVTGFLLARFTDQRGLKASGAALVVVVVALAYGLVLSTFVEIAIL